MRKYLTRKNIIIVVVVLAILVILYFLLRKPPLAEGLLQVNGRIEGDVVVVSSKYNGKITKLLAREGDSVTRGQLVVRLDDPETRDRLAQAQQSFDSAISLAKGAEQNVGLTSETGNSVIEQAKGQVAQAQGGIEDAQASVKAAEANVRNAEAAVRAAAATTRQAQAAVGRYASDVQTAQANLQSNQKLVESARSQAKLSAANARRYTALAKEGVVTEQQRDEFVTAAAKDEAQLQSAVANANSSKAQVSSKESDLQQSKEQVNISRADLQRAQTSVVSAQEQLNSAKGQLNSAKGKKEQADGILKQAMTSPLQVAMSKSSHSSSMSQAKMSAAAVNEQRSILSNLYVVSPITGMVVTRIRDKGEVVTAGSPILEVVNLDRLYLKAYVPEKDIGKVRLGLPAKVYVDSYPDHPFDATVRYISSQAEFTPKEVQTPDERVKLVYAVKLYLNKNPDHKLTPGMPADAIIRWKRGVAWQKPQY